MQNSMKSLGFIFLYILEALGTGFQNGLRFRDIEIAHTEQGAPYVLHPDQPFLLSISHCQTYATATAILLDHRMKGDRNDAEY